MWITLFRIFFIIIFIKNYIDSLVSKIMFKIFLILFSISFYAISQNIEWANKISYKYVVYQSEWNYAELMLGPPSIYPSNDYETNLHDIYADGYLIYKDNNKSETLEFGFIKPMPVNQIVIGGIFNEGVIKRVSVQLKDKSFKEVYGFSNSQNTLKYNSKFIKFKKETVYGVKITFDHTKINNWNIVKGIGILNSDSSYIIKPELFSKAEFLIDKDTVGHDINTHECFEFNPRLSSEGSSLFFVKECKNSDQDIWFANLDSNGNWEEAVNVQKPLNNSGHNFVASVSMDGKTLFLGNNYTADGHDGGMGLSVSHWQSNKTWSVPENINLPPFINKHEYINYFMSPNQDAIIFALEDDKSIGDLDLYVSLLNKSNNKWGEILNLGASINTSFGEDYPYLAVDGKTLYFSSKGHIGYGSYDIYMSKRLDNTWTKWSKPINLGNKVNSKTDDNGFMISNSGEEAYFNAMALDSVHNMNIFKIKLPKILQQEAQVLIKGKVVNIRNGKPVKTNIRFKEKGKKKYENLEIKNDEDGNFSFILPHGKEYDILVEGSRFYKINDQISLLDSNIKTKVMKKYLVEPFLDSGQVSVMNNLQFEYGTSIIKDSSFKSLDKLAKQMIEQSKAIYEVAGHTDDVGSDQFNLILSEERAKSISNYLEKKGVRPWKLKPKGYGESVPIESNATPEGRAENRRVEISIIKFLKDYSRPKNENTRFKQSKQTKPSLTLLN